MQTEERRLAKNAYMRQWKKDNKDKVNRINQNYKDANRESVRKKERGYASKKAGTGEGYRKLWLSNIRLRAKKKGLPFDITLDDLFFPETCPVLGVPMKERSGSFCDNSPSIDRIENDKGYVKGNVRIISYRANRIKCHATIADLEKILDYMRREAG